MVKRYYLETAYNQNAMLEADSYTDDDEDLYVELADFEKLKKLTIEILEDMKAEGMRLGDYEDRLKKLIGENNE